MFSTVYKRIASIGWLMVCLAAPFGAVQAAAISKTDVSSSQAVELVTFYATDPLTVRSHFSLQNPERLVIDLARIEHGKGVGLSPAYRGNLLRSIRFGQYNPQTSRVVMDLAYPVGRVSIEAAPQRTADGWALTVRLPVNASAPPTQPVAQPAVQEPVPTSGTGGFTPVPADKPLEAAQEAKKPLIVIDAGHGGKDVGAIGKTGVYEKTITLTYAQALRDELISSGRYRVMMTRDGDSYLFLHDRVNIARKNKADVFISLHADSNPRADAKGLSIYTVSETASDAEAAALAARENKSDIIGGIDLSVEDKAVADILIDLAQRETKNKASDLADIIISHIHPKIPLLGNTHRYAGFRVLKAPDTPSVLIEIGFLTNSSDETRIQSRENRDKFTRSLLQGLDAYFKR